LSVDAEPHSGNSSLVAMEAIACGTPVVAYAAGALPDIIDPGSPALLWSDHREMAEAIHAVDSIDVKHCRETARRRFSQESMIEAYFGYYRELAARKLSTERWSA
jgi:glycosyltransferase involved in cell wall biosynthesis